MEKSKKIEKIGETIGFVVMYFLFTTILYFILRYTDKLPESWGYFHLSMITLFFVLLSILIEKIIN